MGRSRRIKESLFYERVGFQLTEDDKTQLDHLKSAMNAEVEEPVDYSLILRSLIRMLANNSEMQQAIIPYFIEDKSRDLVGTFIEMMESESSHEEIREKLGISHRAIRDLEDNYHYLSGYKNE